MFEKIFCTDFHMFPIFIEHGASAAGASTTPQRPDIYRRYMKNLNFDEALETLNMGIAIDSTNPHIHYNYACYYSLTGQTKASMEKLQKAIRLGFTNFKQIETDPDLEKLRQSPEFKSESLKSNTKISFKRYQRDRTRRIDF